VVCANAPIRCIFLCTHLPRILLSPDTIYEPLQWVARTALVRYILRGVLVSAMNWQSQIRTVRILRQFASPAEARKAALALWTWAVLVSLSGIGMTLVTLASRELNQAGLFSIYGVWFLSNALLFLNFDKALKVNKLPMGWAVLGMSAGAAGLVCIPLIHLGFDMCVAVLVMPFIFAGPTIHLVSILNQRTKKPHHDSPVP